MSELHVTFVVLSAPRLPDEAAVCHSHRELFAELPAPTARPRAEGLLEFETPSGRDVLVSLMPVPVPGREASEAARFSVEGDAEERAAACDAHAAHLIVATHADDPDRISALGEHTRMAAAVALAAEAIAIYDGASRATYSPGFYGSVAAEDLPLPLWTGVSAGAEADGRLSFVSLGMARLELPNIVVAAAMERADEAWSFLFSLCAYMITQGAFSPGDTVGHSGDEQLTLLEVPSPVFPSETAFRVELL